MKNFAVLLLVSLGVGACSEASKPTHTRQFLLVVESPFNGQVLAPGQARAYNPNNLVLAVKLNGADAETRRIDSTSFEVSGSFSGNTVEIDVSWSEIYQQITMQLATFTGTYPVSDQAIFTVQSADYNSSIFDNDKDNDSNLSERLNDTNPYNSNECSTCRSDVDSHILRISASEAPVINGRYDGVWTNSQFKDLEGDLFIRKLVDTGGSALDTTSVYGGEPPFRWASMHDGEYLYILVLGESAEAGGQTPYRDSAEIIDDDSVYIAIEASTGFQAYEVPLLDINNNENSTEVLFYNGGDAPEGEGISTAVMDPRVSVGTCMCSGDQSLWEIRIPLSSLNGTLTIGDPFKILIEIVDDVDGGAAEFYWQWPRDTARFDGTVALR